MADEIIKIQELPETNTVADSNVLPIVQGGVTYKIPYRIFQGDVADKAEAAADSAQAAAASSAVATEKAGEASLSAIHAAESETNAQTYAEAAQTAKNDAQTAETNSNEYSIAAESWAVGGTDTREFEDYDNAKYYSELSRQGANRAGWVDFYIDSDGYLHYRKTPNTELEFYIQNGYLHVILGA